MPLALICFVAAAICFFLAFVGVSVTYNTGTAPNQRAHAIDFVAGGFFFVTLGLWIVGGIH